MSPHKRKSDEFVRQIRSWGWFSSEKGTRQSRTWRSCYLTRQLSPSASLSNRTKREVADRAHQRA
ncbi:MAG TPA: hypothetical protein VFV38_49810 [Ktedonobacteraceae bacterium]|nr:hypothetical protein [Ktedonobacteraceae bacterium]